MINKDLTLAKKRSTNLSIQDLINKVRSNKSLSGTIQSATSSAIITPKPIKKRTKIVLNRYHSNFSLTRPNNGSTGLQQFTESNNMTLEGPEIDPSKTLNFKSQ